MARKRITLDDPKVDRLLNALKAGHFVQEACQYAPISEQTYYRWLREGKALDARAEAGDELTAEEQGIRELCEAIKVAEVSGQNAALDKIRDAINSGTWQAAAWFLERRNKKWSNRTEVTGPDGGPVHVVTPEDVDAKLRGLIDAYRAEHEIAE
ncbi:MAG TPA: transposase [Acidimicrobiia bacterium]